MADMDKALTIKKEMKDPNFRYAWVLDEPKTQTVYKMMEYEHVKANDPDGAKFKSDPRLASDGKIRCGDVVLMRCKEEIAQAREAESKAKRTNRIPSIKEDFHGTSASLGIKSFEDNKP